MIIPYNILIWVVHYFRQMQSIARCSCSSSTVCTTDMRSCRHRRRRSLDVALASAKMLIGSDATPAVRDEAPSEASRLARMAGSGAGQCQAARGSRH